MQILMGALQVLGCRQSCHVLDAKARLVCLNSAEPCAGCRPAYLDFFYPRLGLQTFQGLQICVAGSTDLIKKIKKYIITIIIVIVNNFKNLF